MKKHILLCDDEVHVIRPAEITLRRAGYEISIAADGNEAWALIQCEKPDLLITDIKMPLMDGWELCNLVRGDSWTRDLPIFVLTGKAYEISETEMAQKWGVLRRITKPYSPKRLLGHVNELFDSTGQTTPPDSEPAIDYSASSP